MLKRSGRPGDRETLEVQIATHLLRQRIAQRVRPVALPKLPPPAPHVKRGGGRYRAVAGEFIAAELQARGIRSAEEEEAARKRQHAAYLHMKKLEGRPQTPELEREIAMLRAKQELLKGRRKAFKAKAKPTSGRACPGGLRTSHRGARPSATTSSNRPRDVDALRQ